MDDECLARAELLSDIFTHLVRVTLSERVVGSFSDAQITYSQFEALRFVQRHPGSTVGDLSEGLHISYPSATNMASRLRRKGLIQKRGIRSDKRIVRLVLTPAGEKLVMDIAIARGKQMNDILSSMRNVERQQFAWALDNFIHAAKKCGLARGEDLCLSCGSDGVPDCTLIQTGTVHVCR